MSTKVCAKCKFNVTPKQKPGISCVDCNKPWHWICTGLSTQEQSTIIKKNLSWTCFTCKRRSQLHIEPATAVSPSIPSVVPSTSQAATNKSELVGKVAQLERANKRLEDLLSSAIARIDSLEEKLSVKSAQIDTVSSEVHRIEIAADSIEKNLVDDNLEVQNLLDSDLEDPLSAATRIGQAIGCPVTASDFKTAPFADRKRLRLTFNSKATRRNFLVAGKQFNRSNKRFSDRKIHINEELTASQRRLYEATLVFKNTHQFKFCWFGISGQLLLKKDEQSQPHVIHSMDTLKDEIILSEPPRNPNEVAGVPPIDQTLQ